MIRTRLKAVYWTDSPADLNGLAHFSERPNLVSARVSSRFKRALPLRRFHDVSNVAFKARFCL